MSYVTISESLIFQETNWLVSFVELGIYNDGRLDVYVSVYVYRADFVTYQAADAYSEPIRTSKMELFGKIPND